MDGNIKQGKVSAEEKALMLYGFFGTMPILTIGGMTFFTWFTMAFVMVVIIKTINKKKIYAAKSFNLSLIMLLTVLSVISCIVCLCSPLPRYCKSIQPKNIIWEICYFIIIYFYSIKGNRSKLLFYLKGVKYAAVFQMLWGYLQLFVFEIFGVSINEVIFANILHMQTRNLTQVKGNSIALTGMCWNVGNMAPLIIIGYMLTNFLPLKIMFLVFSVVSGSRTLLLGMMVCVFLQFIFQLWKHSYNVKRTSIILFVAFVFSGLLFVMVKPDIIKPGIEKVTYLITLFSKETLTTQASARIHTRYWITIPEVTNYNSLIHNLFGYGVGNSGYPFSVLYNQFVGEPWTVECDFINRLWGYGYLGFAMFYVLVWRNLWRSRKIDERYLILFFAILVEGVTYNVLFNWCYIAFIFIFLLIESNVNIFSTDSNKIKEER